MYHQLVENCYLFDDSSHRLSLLDIHSLCRPSFTFGIRSLDGVWVSLHVKKRAVGRRFFFGSL